MEIAHSSLSFSKKNPNMWYSIFRHHGAHLWVFVQTIRHDHLFSFISVCACKTNDYWRLKIRKTILRELTMTTFTRLVTLTPT